MKALTDRQKLLLYRKTVIAQHYKKPKFFIGNKVKVVNTGIIRVTKEWNEHSHRFEPISVDANAWSWLDLIRLERVGKVGMVVSMQHNSHAVLPEVSHWNYQVKFEDGARIVMYEPYLERKK